MTPAVGLRVVHWCPHLHLGGGIANAVIALARAQRELGAQTLIVAPAPQRAGTLDIDNTASRDGLYTWEPARHARLGNMIIRQMRRRDAVRLAAFEPDLVHVHAEFCPDNLRVPWLFHAPIVLSPQGAFHPLVLRSSMLRNKHVYAHIAKLMLYSRVDRFHALTEQEAAWIERLLPSARVYLALQGSTLELTAAERRRSGGSPTSPVTLVFVGRLDTYTKGLDVLIDAFAVAQRQLPRRELRLVLTGPEVGKSGAELASRARAAGVGDRVRFIGSASRSQVAEVLRSADVYVQFSRHEGLSLSVCEALAAGLPAVLTIASCPSRDVAAFEHVEVVEAKASVAAAALVHVVRELEAYSEAAIRNMSAVKELFSWKRIARTHLVQYREVVDSHATR